MFDIHPDTARLGIPSLSEKKKAEGDKKIKLRIV
jgi:hypothetical protein